MTTDEEKTSDKKPVDLLARLLAEFKTEKIFNALLALIALLVSLGTLFGGYRFLMNDAKAQTTAIVDAGLSQKQTQIDAIQKDQFITNENQKVVVEQVDEMRKDLRELYKAQRYDRASPRLEAPLPSMPVLKELTSKDGGR